MNDDELLARLKATDPALTSKTPPPDLNRLLEAAMTADTMTHTPHGTATGPRRRPLMLAAAAAALLVGGGISWGVTQSGDTPPATAAPLTLTVQKRDAMTACAELNAATLHQYTTAFEGTATSVKGDQVSLRVDYWYRGEETPTVRINNNQEGAAESFGQEFTVGETYLVYAKDGKIPPCYGDAEVTPELRSLYNQAYPVS
ncbi:hypothetical protein [Streptomyces yerevanensis]|uniref:hypothetical protein n=1 Tax=Streptomyces yerevanensis TaxID=66378 RepID=UPI0005268609|nr:hypothetical protein [Streptomyces yerevanensis]